MLFLVPASDTPSSGNPQSGDAQRDSSRNDIAQDAAGSSPTPDAPGAPGAPDDDDEGASIKVELDLDDAPFLNDLEEEEKEEEAVEEEVPTEEEKLELPAKEEAPKKGLLANKKKLVMLATALLLVIAGVAGAFFFFFSGDAEPEPKPEDKKRIVVVSSQPDESAVAVQVVELKPFIVPSKGSEGEIRLLHCTLNIPYDDPVQSQEIGVRMLEIRNAIYYYLVNKPLAHLSSEEEAAMLKQDLVNVINELLTMQKINDIYIQEYVITAP